MSRYLVRRLPRGDHWGIYDREMRDFCGMPRGQSPGWWLVWATEEKARQWLEHCEQVWAGGKA